MRVFPLTFCAMIGVSIVACTTKPDPGTEKGAKNPTWKVLVSENHCAIEKPRNVVAKTVGEFDKLWQEAQSGIDAPPQKPAIDFTKQWVIASFLGTVRTAGHRVEVQSVTTIGNATVVTWRHVKPREGSVTAQVIETPYTLASIDHAAPATIEFKTVIVEE